MDREIAKRLRWIKLFEEAGHAGLVCLKCGISRPTLRKWLKRYQALGIEGLQERSRRPKTSPSQKIFVEQEALILRLRRERSLGHRRLASELKRNHDQTYSLATVHKVLQKNAVKLLGKRSIRKTIIRYNRLIPGERIQVDTCKIAPGLYQYTAIDDCTRWRVLRLYSRRTAENSLNFLDCMIEEFPFAFQRIQTDRGREFFAYKFQERLMEYGLKFRPIKPRSPHLNGKVERSQKTDLEEFYPTVNLQAIDLHDRLSEWQHYYNWERPHGSLSGKTPIEKVGELASKLLLWEEIDALYDSTKERIQEQNYQADLMIRKLKRCL
jgi:transposase InsO family protein